MGIAASLLDTAYIKQYLFNMNQLGTVLTSYPTTDLATIFREYQTKLVFATDLCNYNSANYHTSIITNIKTEWLTALFNHSFTDYDLMYISVNPPGPTPAYPTCVTDLASSFYDVPISVWSNTHLGCSGLAPIMNTLSNTDFDAATTGLSMLGDVLNTMYADTLRYNALVAYDKFMLCQQTWALYPGSSYFHYWTNWMDTVNGGPDNYWVALKYFPLYAGYTQDEKNYYTKEQYLLYVKDYFGQGYYDSLIDYYTSDTQSFVENFKLEELYLYGSSRLGSIQADQMIRKQTFAGVYSRLTGSYTNRDSITDTLYDVNYNYKTLVRSTKRYELSNHLGNVLAVISDQWKTQCTSIEIISGGDTNHITYFNNYKAILVQATDYHPFGSVLPGRSWSEPSLTAKYKFGFNGKDKVDEIHGEGNAYDFGARIYDDRLGRFLSIDPVTKSFPMLSPYQFASNSPVLCIDIDGLEGVKSNFNLGLGFFTSLTIKTATADGVVNNAIKATNMDEKYKDILNYRLVKGSGPFDFRAPSFVAGTAILGFFKKFQFAAAGAVGLGYLEGMALNKIYVVKMETIVNSEKFKANEVIISKYEEVEREKNQIETKLESLKKEDGSEHNSKEIEDTQKKIDEKNGKLAKNKVSYEGAKSKNEKAIKNVFKFYKSAKKIIKQL